MAEKYDFMENFDKNNARFKSEISKYIDENIRKEGHIVLGETPPVLALAGADTKLPLVINNHTIDHIINKHLLARNITEKIEVENIINMNEYLINPICIINGDKKDAIMVIIDIKNINNDNIVIPIEINRKHTFNTVNLINTEYPKENIIMYVSKEILKHNLIAYNNKKLEDLLHSIGLLLPVENTSTSSNNNISHNIKNVNSYDDSIVHNLENVKYVEKERLLKFNTDNKFFKPTFKANFTELNKATNDLGLGDASKYFRYGEEISPALKERIMWNSKVFGSLYTTKLMDQIANKLIENKTKEIEEKLKEIKVMLKKEKIKANDLKIGDGVSLPDIGVDKVKSIKIDDLGKVNVSFENASMGYVFDKDDNITVFNDTSKTKDNVQNVIDVKEFIENNIKSYFQGNGYKDAITLDQKIVNQYEYLEKHFINDIKEQKGVGYHAAKGAALGLFMDDPTIESKLYPDYKGDVFEKYCKDCSIVFDNMYKQSKENLLKIREEIKEQIKEAINDFEGKTDDEKMLNFYQYYKDVYEKQHCYSDEKGVGYNFAKHGNGACLIYYEEVRKFYNYKKEKSSLDFKTYEEFRNYKDNIVPVEDEKLYNTYLKDVNDVCNEMYNEALDKVKENSIYGKAIKEVEERDEVDTLLAEMKQSIGETMDKDYDKEKYGMFKDVVKGTEELKKYEKSSKSNDGRD